MPVGIHAQGFVGVAFETVVNTYVPPTRFFPIVSESLTDQRDHGKRRVIRGLADDLGLIAGYSHIEGDIETELLEMMLPYFLYVSRNNVVKTGAGPNYVYTTTPTHAALGSTKPSLSITVVRAGVTFAYTGCLCTGIEITLQDGIPHSKFTIMGQQEASQTLPTYTAVTTDIPFGVDLVSIEIPTTTQVFDCADLTFTVNDNGAAQNRINGQTYAQYINFGQREVTASITRDFSSRTEWDAFKALTATSITLKFIRGVNNSVQVTMANAQRDTYDLDGLSDQGTLHQAKIGWEGCYDPTTSKAYEIICKCQESIT